MTNKLILKRIKVLTIEHLFVCDSSDGQWYSYSRLWEKAWMLSSEIEASGAKQIIAVMQNGLDLFVLFFASMLSNVTIVPVDPIKSEKEIEKIISENQGAYVLWDSDPFFRSSQSYDYTRERLLGKIEQIDLDKDYMITYTSGSTGFAKGVRHSLRNLFLAADSFGKAVELGENHTMCHVMPMTYMAGILNTIIMPFWCGSRIVLMPRFDVMTAVGFWKTVKQYEINAFWLSPTMLHILLTVDRKGEGKDAIAGKAPLFLIGTAPLPLTLRRGFEEKYGVKLLQSYGLSETLFLSTELPFSDNDAASVGILLPECDIKLREDGEIEAAVPWMFFGYTNDRTEDYFEGNRYKTGDLGECKDGVLYITGRKKDLIVKGGMNISPRQIEECILDQGKVQECAVSGIPVREEEKIVCWYVSSNHDSDLEKQMNHILEEKLGRHCRVEEFIKTNEIPKNLNGKPDKKRLVSEYQHDH